MKKIILLLSTLLIFAVLNYGIYQKEQTIANGEIVLLTLAPVDPRSLMQGDYMRLRYAIERSINCPKQDASGYIVITIGHNKIGTFTRCYTGEELTEGEKLLHYNNNSYGSTRIVPDSFMFQEGHAKLYEMAKYGIFKFDAAGSYILIGLADEDMQMITP